MANWKMVGVNLGVGAVAGVADQLIKRVDASRATTAGVPQLKWTKRFGTYFNFGVPLVAVAAVGLNKLQRDWATRALVRGGQLAGREATQVIQNRKGTPVAYNPVKWNEVGYTPAMVRISHQDLPAAIPPYAPGATGKTARNLG
jgi:hypothetical protein